MKHFGLLILTYFAAVVQAGTIFVVPLTDVAVLFLPLVLIYAVFLLDGWVAVAWAGVIGLVSDALHSGPMGIDLLCAVLVSGIVLQVYRKDANRSMPVKLQFAASMVFLFVTLSLALGTAVAQHTVTADKLFSTAALQSVGSILAGAVLLLIGNAARPLLRRERNQAY